MRCNSMKRLVSILLLVLSCCLAACSSTELSPEEAAALGELTGGAALSDITRQTFARNEEWQDKYRAVQKIYHTPAGDWAVISAPVGYNGPISLALVIAAASGQTQGLSIVSHNETRHYVRGMEEGWFTDRFLDKQATDSLRVSRLEAKSREEVVAITGATVSTQAVVNGVNAALSLYDEAVLGHERPAVAYTVDFTAEEGEGPEENGVLTVRAYGLVLGEIALEQIQALPSVERRITIHSTAGETEHRFTGVLLSQVLNAVDPALTEEYDLIMTVGVDDYCSGIKMSEALKENAVYLVYADNGQPLPQKDGDPGGFRVIILDDFFGQRFTNYMLEIVLEKD